MKIVAAYLLAVLGGNSHPSADDIRSILESVGAEGDNGRIDLLLYEVSKKDITELVAVGREKVASVPSGGAVAAVAVSSGGGGGGGGGAGATPAAEDPKKEEVEEKGESDDDMGFSLFD